MPASRSLIALLVGTVVFFALWLVALKPGSSSKGGSGSSSSQGLGAYQSDINKAHQAVAISNASNAASGNENAAPSTGGAAASQPSTTPKTTTSPAKTSAKASASMTTHPATKQSTSTAQHAVTNKKVTPSLANNLTTVEAALQAHKVLAMLFYNPSAADDQAVKQELAAVPTHKGQVVKLSIPLSEAFAFTPVTQQVPVNLSPTLVLISPQGQASEIVGFTTSFEISQRVAGELAS